MKKMAAIVWVILLLTGCASNSMNESSYENPSYENTSSKIFNVESSHFDSYTNEQTDTAYIVKGRVSQEDDGNAIAVKIYAEESVTVNVKGILTKVSGNDSELVYVSEDGKKVEIADNSCTSFDTTITISKGDGKIVFMGKSAVRDWRSL